MRRRKTTEDLMEPAISQTFHRDGVIVRTRCRRVSGRVSDRFEVYIEGLGQAAILDIPAVSEEALASRLDQAVGCFIESARLQANPVFHLT